MKSSRRKKECESSSSSADSSEEEEEEVRLKHKKSRKKKDKSKSKSTKKKKKRKVVISESDEETDEETDDSDEDDDEPRYDLAKRGKRMANKKTPGGINLQKLFMAAIIARANQAAQGKTRGRKHNRSRGSRARDGVDRDYDSSSSSSSSSSSDDAGDEDEDDDDEDDDDYVPPTRKHAKPDATNSSTRTVRRRLSRALLPLRGGVLPEEEEKYIRSLPKDRAKLLLKQVKLVTSKVKRTVPLAFRVLNWPCTAQTKSMICERITQVEDMEPGEGEYAKLSTWLQNVDALPIGKHTILPVNIKNDSPEKVAEFLTGAQSTLDAAVHGHAVAKKEIVRLCAQWISNPNAPTQALAIQGPMGNGKTTLVKRGIAKVMNRPFVFIALGGAQDASFLSGHDYTYEGARPGRIATAIKSAGCMDPVIFLDELDKLSDTAQGREIQHTLLHLLDTSQNSHFRDKYFDGIDLDLSRALFVVSFNDPSKIDRILLDRMRVVVTHGFGVQDKLQIAKEFMIPNILADFKLSHDDIEITDEAVKSVIQNFTEEKGVRCLRRCIHQICAEANLQRLLSLDKQKKKAIVDAASVGKYVKSLRPQGKDISSMAMYS